MSQAREIRDPIHRFVEIRSRECDILDTPLLQRLRRIRQLAMAYLVYPGAVHTRFDHTLGVLGITGSLCSRLLDPKDEHIPLVRYAALLHDVGHGPFSHVSEPILKSISDPAHFERVKTGKIHELIAQRIINEHPDLHAALSDKDRTNVAQLLNEGLDKRKYKDIVSGALDADKQDYLLRDSYFCGVNYGVYDIHQLHQTLCIGQEDGDEVLMVEGDGVHALEQFVLAKYYLTTQVYRHRVRIITDNMLRRAMELGVKEDKIPFLCQLYTYQPNGDYLKRYLEWDDQRLTLALLESEHESTHAGKLFRRLVDRRLFKQIFSFRLKDLRHPIPTALPQKFDDCRQQIELRLAEELNQHQSEKVDPHHVILHIFSIASVRTQSQDDEGGVLIKKEQRPVPFVDESTLFQSIDQSLMEEYVECYAPITYPDEKAKAALKEGMEICAQKIFAEVFDDQLKLPVTAQKP